MQIQLKQAEIVEALKQYIAKKGISLTGKEVVIGFTAGRKETGISADISIEDVDMPEFTGETPKPVLSVVKAATPAYADVVEPIKVDAAAPAQAPAAAAAVVAEAPGKSLFS